MIYVPIDKVGLLKISGQNLPKDPAQLIEQFEKEKVPISFWLKLALLYHKKGEESNFERILEEALKNDV